MPTYVLLSSLTEQGQKTIRTKPDRIKQVNKEIETMGAKVIAQYALLGPYDFVTILEAKDNKAIARISVDLGSRGSVKFLSMPAIPIDEFIDSIK